MKVGLGRLLRNAIYSGEMLGDYKRFIIVKDGLKLCKKENLDGSLDIGVKIDQTSYYVMTIPKIDGVNYENLNIEYFKLHNIYHFCICADVTVGSGEYEVRYLFDNDMDFAERYVYCKTASEDTLGFDVEDVTKSFEVFL